MSDEEIRSWVHEHLPEGVYGPDVSVYLDRDEVLIVGPPVEAVSEAEGGVDAFREETREARMRVARKAEARFGRKVAWGVRVDDTEILFTHLSVPVMTRLRVRERQLLDTLVAAGVARSRSDALGWCVRLVADRESDWLAELRDAISVVEKVRADGPT